jgi:hypothetical protein
LALKRPEFLLGTLFMAQADIYCGLCGAALSIPLFSAADAQDENGPGDVFPRIEDMDWLEDVRILYRSTDLTMGFRRSFMFQKCLLVNAEFN